MWGWEWWGGVAGVAMGAGPEALSSLPAAFARSVSAPGSQRQIRFALKDCRATHLSIAWVLGRKRSQWPCGRHALTCPGPLWWQGQTGIHLSMGFSPSDLGTRTLA